MLLQGEALSPLLRYQYLPTLGLPRPDQHLAIRAMNTDFDRIIDTRNPLQKNPSPHPEPGALDWLIEGVCALHLYPQSTGQEGSSYLCRHTVNASFRRPSEQGGFKRLKPLSVYVVSAEPKAEQEGHCTIYAIQNSKRSLVEHHCLVIELSTTVENNHQTINGSISPLSWRQSPGSARHQKQRYAIPPVNAVFQKNKAENHTQPWMHNQSDHWSSPSRAFNCIDFASLLRIAEQTKFIACCSSSSLRSNSFSSSL